MNSHYEWFHYDEWGTVEFTLQIAYVTNFIIDDGGCAIQN